MGQCVVSLLFWCSGSPPPFSVLLCTHQTGCSVKRRRHDDKTMSHYSAHPDAGLFIQIKNWFLSLFFLPSVYSLWLFVAPPRFLFFVPVSSQNPTPPLPPAFSSPAKLANVFLIFLAPPFRIIFPVCALSTSMLLLWFSFSVFHTCTPPIILFLNHLKPVTACHPIMAGHPDNASVSQSS